MDNKHIFSEEYTEKKNARLRALAKNGDDKSSRGCKVPLRTILVAAVVAVVLTTSLMAAGIAPLPKYIFRTNYVPEAAGEIVSDWSDPEADVEIVSHVKYLGEKGWTKIEQREPLPEGMSYEIYDINGHYAELLYRGPKEKAHFDYVMYVVYEEENIVVQLWCRGIPVEEIIKTAEGLSLELTEDESLAVKLYSCD